MGLTQGKMHPLARHLVIALAIAGTLVVGVPSSDDPGGMDESLFTQDDTVLEDVYRDEQVDRAPYAEPTRIVALNSAQVKPSLVAPTKRPRDDQDLKQLSQWWWPRQKTWRRQHRRKKAASCTYKIDVSRSDHGSKVMGRVTW